MEVPNRQEIKALLSSQDTMLKHSLGQNYLVSERSVQVYIEHLVKTDTIIEIGPGIGNITINYFTHFKKVILIELDKQKVPILIAQLTKYNNGTYPGWVEIINSDVLETPFTALVGEDETYQVIGALPYNIAKRIIRQTLETFPSPKQAAFIVQREVADKYVAAPPQSTFLSVSSQIYAAVKRAEILKRSDFYPAPKVDSRILLFTEFKIKGENKLQEASSLAKFIKQGFASPRKKLINTVKLPKTLAVTSKILQKRPQELSLSEWKSLYSGNF